MNILTLSDLHIGCLPKDHSTLNMKVLCSSIKDQHFDMAVFTGDIFDNSNIGTRHMTTHECLELFSMLLDTIKVQVVGDTPIYILRGNHDIVSTKDAKFLPIKLDNVTIINKPILLTIENEKIAFWPWMYDGKYSLTQIMDSNATLFAHCLWKEVMWGSKYKSDAYNTFHTEELMAFNAAYLGHVHYRYSHDTIHYIGQPWHTRFFGNKAQERAAVPGYVIVNTENPYPKWVDIDTVKFIDCYTQEEYNVYKDTNHRLSIHFTPPDIVNENTTIAKVKVKREELDIASLDPASITSASDCWHYWADTKDLPQDEIDLGDSIILLLGRKTDFGRSLKTITSIKKVTLKNLCNHSNFVLEPGESTVLKGNFGCGKTIVLEAVMLALYGVAPIRSSMRSVLKDDETTGKAILELYSFENKYVIERTITKEKSKTTQSVKIVKNGEDITPELISDAEALIEREFGSYDLAVSTWFMCQKQKVGSMIGNTAANIERIMRNILGHDVLDDIYGDISTQANTSLKDLASKEATVKRLSSELDSMPTEKELQKQIKEYDSQNIDSIMYYRKKRESLDSLKSMSDKFNRLYTEYSKLVQEVKDDIELLGSLVTTAGLSNMETKIKLLTREIEADTGTLASLQQNLDGELEKKLKDRHCEGCVFLKTTKDTVESLTNRISKNVEELNSLHEPLANLSKVRPFEMLLERNSVIVTQLITHLCDDFPPRIQNYTVYDFVAMLEDMLAELSIDIATIESELSSTIQATSETYKTSPRDTLAIRNNTLNALEKARRDLDEEERKKRVLTELRSCFAPGGIPYLITSHVIPSMNEAISEMESLLELPFSLRVTQDTGRGGKPTFSFMATIRGKERDASSGSEGEKLNMDICVRLAMVKLMGNSRVLIADEVYEGLHDSARDGLVDILFNTGLIDQTLLSTHIDVSTDAQIVNL